jgi:hypothetical protein
MRKLQHIETLALVIYQLKVVRLGVNATICHLLWIRNDCMIVELRLPLYPLLSRRWLYEQTRSD